MALLNGFSVLSNNNIYFIVWFIPVLAELLLSLYQSFDLSVLHDLLPHHHQSILIYRGGFDQRFQLIFFVVFQLLDGVYPVFTQVFYMLSEIQAQLRL